MGSGVSSLTSEQKALLTSEVKALYEKCTTDGLDDDIVQEIVTNEYKRVLKSIAAAPPPKIDSKPAPLAHALSAGKIANKGGLNIKAVSGSSKDGKSPKVTRRRSFDTSRISGGGKKTVDKDEIQAILNSRSEALLQAVSTDAGEPAVDSWDSVTQQPFCHICNMAFKSVAFLERHTKYSDFHIKNAAQKDTDGKKTEEPATAAAGVVSKVPSAEDKPLVANTSSKLAEPQIEGKHYKLLYTGSKFFWRTQKTIDLDIYLHVQLNVLEVISFDSDKHKETSRIYLDYTIIQKNLEHLVNADFDEKVKELKQDRFFALEDEQAFRTTLLLQRVSTYLLQRLQLDSTAGAVGGEVAYVQLYGDADVESPLLAEAPAALTPLHVNRRRKTSSAEIEATINSLRLDSENIDHHLDVAQSLTRSPSKMPAPQGPSEGVQPGEEAATAVGAGMALDASLSAK